MGRKIYIIMALLTFCITGVRAQEIEVPEDAPRETWQFVYDDYRSVAYYNTPEYKDLTMDVTVVRGENGLYVQGLAKSCPTSWVKLSETGDILNNQLLLWSNQPVEVTGETQYLNTGYLNRDVNSGHTYSMSTIYCISRSRPLAFKRHLASDRLEYVTEASTGFWLNKEPDDGLYFEEFTKWDYYGNITEETKFPEAEVYVNPRLIDKTGGTAGINTPDDDEVDAPIYSLSGIKVDRDHLTPGVYVSRGKKIVVK